jgi:DnaJ-class molecular chaperone
MAHLNDAYEVLVDDAQRHSYDSAVLRLREERQSGAASR